MYCMLNDKLFFFSFPAVILVYILIAHKCCWKVIENLNVLHKRACAARSGDDPPIMILPQQSAEYCAALLSSRLNV